MAATQSSTMPQARGDEQINLGSTEYQLKKYLLLLATLVATVTYAAGLNPPGGSWLEDAPAKGRLAGDSILRETNYRRYLVFYCFNAISFAASLLLSLLLLFLHKDRRNNYLLPIMWTVMLVDGLCLMGAYAAGGSNDRFTTVCAAVLVSAASLYAAVAFLTYVIGDQRRRWKKKQPGSQDKAASGTTTKLGKKHEVLLVLAIFAATVAYVAGLNPPGGFWRQEGHGGAAGHPVLQGSHTRRYKAFFFCNTTAFAASLLAIMLTVDYEKLDLEGDIKGQPRVVALYGLIITALLGLGGAYAAGS